MALRQPADAALAALRSPQLSSAAAAAASAAAAAPAPAASVGGAAALAAAARAGHAALAAGSGGGVPLRFQALALRAAARQPPQRLPLGLAPGLRLRAAAAAPPPLELARAGSFALRGLHASPHARQQAQQQQQQAATQAAKASSAPSSSSSPAGAGLPDAAECDEAIKEYQEVRTARLPSTYRTAGQRAKDLLSALVNGVIVAVQFLLALPGKIWALRLKSREQWAADWASAKKTIKHEAHHYWVGTKLLATDARIASGLALKAMRGGELTRRERRQLTRTTADLFRLVPMVIILVRDARGAYSNLNLG